MPLLKLPSNVCPPVALVLSVLLAGCVVNNQAATNQTAAIQANSAPRPSAASAPAPAQGPQVRGARPGVAQRVDTYHAVNPDCSSAGVATAELLTAPVHGATQFETIQDFSNFPANNQRFDCNKQKTPALTVVYTSAADYKGRDEFAVKVLFPDGMTAVRHFVMNVE